MTTAAPGRIRRSVRFARLESQAGTAAQAAPVRRERMTVTERLEMPSFQNTQDWTGGMGMSPSGRFQVTREPEKKQSPLSRDGVRADWAKVLLWAAIVLMSVTLLVRFASIGASALNIQKLEHRIEAAQGKGEELQRQLAQSSGDISVCTKAVEMNLISSSGAQTIQLTAPQGATMTLVRTQEAQSTEEPELRAAVAAGE